MRINLKNNKAFIITIGFLLFIFLSVPILLIPTLIKRFDSFDLFMFGLLLFFGIFIFINSILGIIHTNKLIKEGNFFIEFDTHKKAFQLVDLDIIMVSLFYVFNSKIVKGSFTDITKIELRKIKNTDALILIFYIANVSKKIRITNKMIEEEEFKNLLTFLDKEVVLVEK